MRVVITGASRGLGKAIAEYYLKKDFYVLGTSVSGKTSFTNTNMHWYPLNLTDEQSIYQFSKQVDSIDLIINNAGVLLESWTNPLINLSQLRKTLEVNTIGTISVTEKLLPNLNPNGKIAFISSNWGSFSDSNFDAMQPLYKISKAALNMYSRLLAERLKSINYVYTFDPGWVKTDMGGDNATLTPNEAAKMICQVIDKEKDSGRFWHNGKTRQW